MNKKMNNKGFTLVELLAVIVVLAIIMVIAMPQVLDVMNSSKKKTFSMYGQKVLTNTQTVWNSKSLLGEDPGKLHLADNKSNDGTWCINIKNLGMDNIGSYKGYVIIDPTGNRTTYTIYLTDSVDFVYNGVLGSNLNTQEDFLKTGVDVNAEPAKNYNNCYPS